MSCWRSSRYPPRYGDASPNFNVRYNKNKMDGVVYTKEMIKAVFRNSDLDGKGKLSKQDLEKAFAHLRSRWPKYRAWRGRIHADADKDGFISLESELDHLVDYTLKLGDWYKSSN